MKYFQNLRMQFISEHIHKHHHINRADIVEKFNISIPQASNDLREWQKLYPGEIKYNYNKKRYERVGGN